MQKYKIIFVLQKKGMGLYTMRLLIIEDDKPLSYELKEGLERKGFAVDVANTGNEGEEKAFVTDYEAMLLNLNLGAHRRAASVH